MITRLINARARLRRNDDGVAIVMVIGISMVLMILVTVALGVSLSGMTKSKTDANLNAAITAAYAGIEDYKSKIANDNSYYRYGNSAAPFSLGSSLAAPPLVNPAFGTGAAGTWATVPSDRSGVETSSYRYEVDSRDYLTSGILKVRSTGRAGNVTRSVVANLKQKGFIDFLYYTDFEITDPEAMTAAQKLACIKYGYNGRATSGCGTISFGKFDVINGPMHTNDQIRACGTVFNGTVTTAWKPTSGDAYLRRDGNYGDCTSGLSETFAKGKPVSVSTVDLPPTNQKMFNEVRTDINAEVPRPGCLYTGPTKIVFNSNGTMTVRSPWTKVTRVSNAAGTLGSINAECGEAGVANGQLGSAGGATVTVPARNMIFVQDVGFIAGTPAALAPQYKSSTYPKKPGGGDYTATDCNAGNFLGYPVANESVRNTVATAYNCKKGDVFVEGTLNGEVSINADNFIYVTNDIKYSTANPDSVLGLIAQNQIWVHNPITNWNGQSNSGSNVARANFVNSGNRTIEAAMISMLKSFQVQNYDVRPLTGSYASRTLNVKGAIAQKYRGPVALQDGTTGDLVAGYKKNYNYDDRFRYIAPPKFLSPVSTTYGITTVVEVKTAYNPDGTKITTP